VTVAPSATWWHAAATGTAAAGTAAATGMVSAPALVVAGPRLSIADSEAAAVARCYPGATVLTGPAATAGAVLGALDGPAVAHVACHGRIRDDNALWSALELSDGPLYLYDLERVARTPPLVVLSGCETGVGVRVGDQLIGLSTVLLRRGTRSLLASVCAVPDSAATRETMRAVHERIAGGTTPAAALAGLCSGWSRDDAGALVAAALCCFGTH
jgi:CHAT domain-containing protein